MDEVSLRTKDGLKIAAAFYPVEDSKRAVILLHMLRRDRSTWSDLAKKLREAGFNVLAIDLRGHGESDGNWEKFSPSDYQKMVWDLAAATKFLQAKIPNLRIVLIGASIGANTALNYASQNPTIAEGIVLLSPGLDYHGIKTQSAVEKNTGAILIVAARDDEYAFSSSQKLFESAKVADKMFQTYEKGGHGTNLLQTQPNLSDFLVSWLTQRI